MLPSVLAADPASPGWLSSLGSLLGLWHLWLPCLIGALSIYWLLPRPRAYPVLWGVLAGLVALGLAGWLLTPSYGPWEEAVLFYSFSGIAILSGTLLITQQNPARAALSFTMVVLSTCGIFLLTAAPFLMAATIIIYAGAIIVTFLFVIMLAQQAGLSDADARSREPALSTFTGFVLLVAILFLLARGANPKVEQLLERTSQVAALENLDQIKEAVARDSQNSLIADYRQLAETYGWSELRPELDSLEINLGFAADDPATVKLCRANLLDLMKILRSRLNMVSPPPDKTLSTMSGPAPNTPLSEVRADPVTGLPQLPAENSAYLGRSLFTDYLLPVELGGLLLLVATIGAIAIAHRRPAAPPAGPEVRV